MIHKNTDVRSPSFVDGRLPFKNRMALDPDLRRNAGRRNYRILPIKWDPILAKTSKFFGEFLSEIPFWFYFVLLGNSVWTLSTRLPLLFPIFRRNPILPWGLCKFWNLQKSHFTEFPFYREHSVIVSAWASDIFAWGRELLAPSKILSTPVPK